MKQNRKSRAMALIAMLCVLAFLMSACATPPSPTGDDTEDTTALPVDSSDASTDDEENPEIPLTPPAEELSDFEKYVSNTSAPTGNNTVLLSPSSTPVTETYRGIFKLQEHGQKEYKFFFSNHVNSTQASGDVAYRDMPTKPYTIESAYVGTSAFSVATREFDGKTALSFDGASRRTVAPDDEFWSDAVTLNVPKGHFLVFEWTVTYTMIPAITTGQTFSSYRQVSRDNYRFEGIADIPMPDLIGCDRGTSLRVGFMGDSITMGTGAGPEYQYWVAQIADGLGEDVSVWNLGLGYARADDAAHSPAWLNKAKQCDVVGLCFGVNDINSGAYQSSRPRTAAEITADIDTVASALKAEGIQVIIFATPPYTYSTDAKVQIWRETVTSLKSLATRKGYDFFDFATPLGKADDPATPAYGGHPNGEGCRRVAEAFLASGLITKK